MINLPDKMRVKVCILTSVHSPFDVRIFHKEAKTLVKGGYDVVLIAQHSREETVDGVRIVPLPEPRNRFERMTKVVWKLFRLALKEKADIYHFHDPELILIGLILKLFGRKVIYDVHEDYPKQILYKEWLRNGCIRKFTAFIIGIIERIGFSFFDGIVAATLDIRKKFPEGKTIILKNVPVLELMDKVKAAKCKKDKPVIIYAGGSLGKVRGTKETIEAMEFIKDRAELWLLGKWESEKFEKECKDLGGFEYTKYLGLVCLSEVYRYTNRADIGMSISYPIKNYITSLPVKAYEYMACSLPMVMSDFPYWQEVFGECAVFADPYSPKDIAEKILYLLDNPDKAMKLSHKGRELVQEKYSWEAEHIKLLDIYKRVLNK